MTRLPPDSDSPDGRVGQQVPGDALQRLGQTIANLAGDSNFIIDSLTELAIAMRPVSKNRLTKQQEDFLIESGTFTAEKLAATSKSVDRGSLQLGAFEAWLTHLCATMSLEDASGFLGWGEEDMRAAVSEGRLYAIEISGRLRFPVWQFNVGFPEKLLPGLTEIIEVVSPRWGWHSVAGFMATPQPSLVAVGRKTPVEWLRDGGDVNDVIEIVEDSDWR